MIQAVQLLQCLLGCLLDLWHPVGRCCLKARLVQHHPMDPAHHCHPVDPAVPRLLSRPYLLADQWNLATPEDQQVQLVQCPRCYQLLQYLPRGLVILLVQPAPVVQQVRIDQGLHEAREIQQVLVILKNQLVQAALLGPDCLEYQQNRRLLLGPCLPLLHYRPPDHSVQSVRLFQ